MRKKLAITLLTSFFIYDCSPSPVKTLGRTNLSAIQQSTNIDESNCVAKGNSWEGGACIQKFTNTDAKKACENQGTLWTWNGEKCIQSFEKLDAKKSCENQGTLWTWNGEANRCDQNTQFVISESLCLEKAKEDSTFSWNATTKRCEEATQLITNENLCNEKIKNDVSYSWNNQTRRCEQKLTTITDEALCREKIKTDIQFSTYDWNSLTKRCEADIHTLTDNNLCQEKHKTDASYFWNDQKKLCEQTLLSISNQDQCLLLIRTDPTWSWDGTKCKQTPIQVTGKDSCELQPGGTDKWKWVPAAGENAAYCQEIIPVATIKGDCITNQKKAWITRDNTEICIPYSEISSLPECQAANSARDPSLNSTQTAMYWSKDLANPKLSPSTGRCFTSLTGEKPCLEKNMTPITIDQANPLKAYNWTSSNQCFKGFCAEGQVHIGWDGKNPICDQANMGLGALVMGARSACGAIGSPLQLSCWGKEISLAQTSQTSTPTPVTNLPTDSILGIAVGYRYGCSIVGSGVYCWGRGGPITNLNPEATLSPTMIQFPDVSNFYTRKIITQTHWEDDSEQTSCAIVVPKTLNKGKLYCWGKSSRAVNTGTGVVSTFVPPQIIKNLPQDGDVTDACLGATHACSIVEHKNNNDNLQSDLYCWGNGEFARLGDGTNANVNKTVTQISLPTGVSSPSKLACGLNHTCVIANSATANGQVYCWGSGDSNVFLNVGQTLVPTPLTEPALSKLVGVTKLTAGNSFSCAVIPTTANNLTTDKLYCWGYNANGQLGIGNTTSSTTSITDVTNWGGGGTIAGTTITDVTIGNQSICAARKEPTGPKKLYCWGYNGWNELMISSTSSQNLAVKVYP